MRLRFQNLLRKLKIIGSLAFNIVQFLEALAFLVTTVAGTAFFAWLFRFQGWLVPLITFLLGLLLEFLLVIYFLLRSSPPRWVLEGYKCVKVDCLYVIDEDDPKHHLLTVEVEIEAIKSGVSIFEDTYLWTGQGKEEDPKVTSLGHTFMGKLVKRDGWSHFYVHLGQELKRGARAIVRTVQELYDEHDKFEPFLARIVLSPVDNLILHVILPKNLSPVNIFFRERNTAGPASRVVEEILGKMDIQSREIRWEIHSPVFGHRYSIEWMY